MDYYFFDLSVAEREFYRLDEEYKLPPELIPCLQQIITTGVSNYVNYEFCLPKTFSVQAVSEQYNEAVIGFVYSCLGGSFVANIKYSDKSTDITLI